jgi:hypothetical protein
VATAGHAGGCAAIFLETDTDAAAVPGADPMLPAVRRAVLGRLGFCALALPYVQPAVGGPGQGKCRDLLLAVHARHVDAATQDTPAGPVRAFLHEFYTVLMGGDDAAAAADPDARAMAAVLDACPTVPTVPALMAPVV